MSHPSSHPLLVVALVAVSSLAHAQAPSAPAAPSARRPARVHVRATEPGVVISRVILRASSSETEASAYQDLCIAPCQFELEPGLHGLRMGGRIPMEQRFDLRPGDTYLVARAGSLKPSSFVLLGLGAAAMSVGGTFLLFNSGVTDREVQGWELPVLLGGTAAVGLSIGLGFADRPAFEVERPRAGPRAGGVGLRVGGQFAGL